MHADRVAGKLLQEQYGVQRGAASGAFPASPLGPALWVGLAWLGNLEREHHLEGETPDLKPALSAPSPPTGPGGPSGAWGCGQAGCLARHNVTAATAAAGPPALRSPSALPGMQP